MLYKVFPGGIMLVMPKPAARFPLILKVHQQLDHFGINRVQQLLQKDCWWRKMGDDVRTVISNCHSCVRAKASFRDPQRELHPLSIRGLGYR